MATVVAGRRRARPRADRADRPDELVPEHRGQPGGDVPVGHVGRAHPAGEHLADDLARTRLRVRRVLDPDVAGRERARHPHGRSVRDAARGSTPRSVTSAVTSAAGVTSKAGLRVRVPGSVRTCPPAERTSSGSRSSIVMSAPVGVAGSIVRGRAGHHERDPGRVRGQRQAVGADLVGHVAVGRHPVAADDHGVDRAGRDQPGRGRVDHQLVRDAQAGQLVDGQAGALEERPRLGGDRLTRGRRARPARRSRRARCRGRGRPARPCCSG